MNRITHIITGLVVAYWIAAIAISLGPLFWSPQPLIDRVEAADPTPVARDAVDFFEHTPRVEALLDLEAATGHTEAERDQDRIGYGISHLLLLLTMAVDLLLVAVVTAIGARSGSFDAPSAALKPRRSITRSGATSTLVLLGITVIGLFAAMYAGFMIHSRHGHGASDNVFVFLFPAHLILVVLIMSAVGKARGRRNDGPVVTR